MNKLVIIAALVMMLAAHPCGAFQLENSSKIRTAIEISPSKADADSILSEPRVQNECRVSPGDHRTGVLTPVLISWLSKLAITGWINHLDKKLKEYSSNYGDGTQWADSKTAFRVNDSSGSQNRSDGKEFTSCFVFRRIDPCPASDKGCKVESVEMEFVGQVKVTPTYSQVRPLALRYKSTKSPAVETAGISIAVTLEGLWSEDRVGRHSKIADSVVLASESLSVDKSRRALIKIGEATPMSTDKLYTLKSTSAFVDWDKYPRLARLPVDLTDGSSFGVTVAVAEVGTPPRYLKALKRFLSDNEDKLSPLLTEAIAKKLSIELPE